MHSRTDLDEILRLLDRDHFPFRVELVADRLSEFLEHFRQLPQGEQAALRAKFGPRHSARLILYAYDMSEEAVRRHSLGAVELGLLAVVLSGTQADFRDDVTALALLHHSVVKLGGDPSVLFGNAAEYASGARKDFILDYLARGEKNIRKFRREDWYGPDGFCYATTANCD